MKVNFSLYNVPNLQSKDKSAQTTQARVVSAGRVKTDELYKLISERSALSSADVKATLDSLNYYFNYFLAQGKSVELDELGIFSLGLKSELVRDRQGKP